MAAFANSTNKTGVVPKKSVFERQREEAEAKKARDDAETAAVYEDFVKSFDDGGNTTTPSRPAPVVSNSSHTTGPGKRHFTSSGLKSGPGSLGPSPSISRSGPGSLGPTPGYGKKRQFDDYSGRRDRERSYGYHDRDGRRDSEIFDRQEEAGKDEEDTVAARPTLHLSSLPPGTSPAVVKALLQPSPLAVENVKISAGPASERKSLSAIVTLAAETSASDIDTMVSHLQNRYLGFGFNLSISRHLSSAALTGVGALSAPGAKLDSLPFGARPISQQTSLSRAPPPGQGRGFAPPASYTSSTPYGSRPQTQVTVQMPSDLKQLKLIHKTIEALLTYGPEFEALLMSRPEIQRHPKWAWLWDPRSQGGVYYRWRLWEILTNSNRRNPLQQYGARASGNVLFEGQSQWVAPEESLNFEYTTKLEDFVSDDDYNSSDEEDDEDAGGLARRHNDHNVGNNATEAGLDTNDGLGYLNPLAKAKLVHLLSRLPDTNAKLRKGDVGRITGFAIEHAGAGADEVAALVTRNAVKPFAQQQRREVRDASSDEEEHRTSDNDQKDTSSASLVGLYIISDILSSSASAGVRHAWRYRALFENALRQQKVFEKLGRIDRDLNWGKLKAEKWKRSVQNLLSMWEGWCVFPQTSHEEFVNCFLNPPLTSIEQKATEAEEQRKEEEAAKNKAINRWKTVDENASKEDVEMSGVDGSAMPAQDNVDGMEMDDDDEDIDGIPMIDSSDEEIVDRTPEPADTNTDDIEQPETAAEVKGNKQATPIKIDPAMSKRQRPKAVDMFADDSD